MKYLRKHYKRIVLVLSVAMAVAAGAQKHSATSATGQSGAAAAAKAPSLVPGPPQSVAFTSNRDGNNEIYVMGPNGEIQTRKTETASSVSDVRPDISPDGTEIVFSSSRDGNLEIFIMNLDGTNVRQLTTTASPVANHWPRWSPDGEWIAFQSGIQTQTPLVMDVQIYRIRRDGSELTQLTDLPNRLNLFPAWSPDGTRLVIRRDNDIYLINSADGEDAVRLTNQGTSNQMASFSPDGTQIAFLSNRDGYGSVFIMNSDGTNQVNFTPRPAVYAGTWSSRAPAWSPNGEFIYFTAVRSVETGNSVEQIWVKPAAGGAETKLTSVGANTEATVRRVAPPTITSISATPDVLWPANGELVPVSLTVSVTDSSDPAPVCQITEVTSSEVSAETDWEITGPLTLELRARRSGSRAGRIYTVAVTCTNTSDLSSCAAATVKVPHDQRKSNRSALRNREPIL